MASWRNLAVSTLKLRGASNIDAVLRTNTRDPQRPLAFLGLA
ncbi:hypothetical protein [Streptomyces noursei]